MNKLQLVHRGSTKDVFVSGDNYLFKFSDRYSVFDWGEMPDQILGKGRALAQFTKIVYKTLETVGIKTHILDLPCGDDELLVRPFEVIRNVSTMPYKENIFVPLEVIFRMGVASGSSQLKRFKQEEDWIKAGYDRAYTVGERFSSPAIEFTTKLERFDRPLSHSEAKQLAGMNDQEWQALLCTTTLIAKTLNKNFEKREVLLWDGKIEFALGDEINGAREVVLVDSIGPDELRLTYQGRQLSKEIIRDHYRDTPWHKKLDEVKIQYGEKFKEFIEAPAKLPAPFLAAISEMYALLAEMIGPSETANSKLKNLLPKLKNQVRVLVLGGGGREHALVWRLMQDATCEKVFVWPGNDGMKGEKIQLIRSKFDQKGLIKLLKEENIKLVIPGAEKFIYAGVGDWCYEALVACFAPSKTAAELERSKIFSKKLMMKANIPTAKFAELTGPFQDDVAASSSILRSFERPVIKISGPCAGKGVFVCADHVEAMDTLDKLKSRPLEGLEEGIFVEEALAGEEVSLFYACHGTQFYYLGAAQDHKRLLDNDEGPNTGGMGAISPVKWVDGKFVDDINERFLLPTLKQMEEMGRPFKGMLFLGLMVGENGPQLLEYNVRFGDPETQVILPLLEGDFTQFILELAEGRELTERLSSKKAHAIHVVKSAKGYPGLFGAKIEKGQQIHVDLAPSSSVEVFFAGVSSVNENLYTDGGRVLGVSAWYENFDEARRQVYHKLNKVTFNGEHYRKDIGGKL